MPTYLQLVTKAIKSIDNGRKGCSSSAIKKFIVANETVTFSKHHLRAALKKGIASGALVAVKNSYVIAKVPLPLRDTRVALTRANALTAGYTPTSLLRPYPE